MGCGQGEGGKEGFGPQTQGRLCGEPVLPASTSRGQQRPQNAPGPSTLVGVEDVRSSCPVVLAPLGGGAWGFS